MPTDAPALPRRLTVADVAECYDVGERTVLAWIKAGELQAVHAGRRRDAGKSRLRITPAALEQFEALRAVTPARPRATKRKPADDDVIEFYR